MSNEATGQDRATIVSEVSKSWPSEDRRTLSMLFEDVIQVNRQRGYRLKDWRFSQVVHLIPQQVEMNQHAAIVIAEPPKQGMTETIIAVFELVGCLEIYETLHK